MKVEHVNKRKPSFVWMLILLAGLPACTSVNTFPMIARAGDTVSVMIGGTEQARKETVDVMMKDVNGQIWDLKALGLVRSVFNLRMDGRAAGLHYSSSIETDISWIYGHEPVQTVLVTDLPADAAPGLARLTISANAVGNSSGIADPFTVKLEIIPGTGSPDQFLRKNSLFNNTVPADLSKLEPAPHVKVSFANGPVIGAASLKIRFNNAVLNGADINIYSPESTVRGLYGSSGAFGETQRMIYWRQDGQYLYIDIIAPQGINGKYLQLFVVHPAGLSGSPNFMLDTATVYDVNGAPLSTQPTLQYFP